MNRNEQKTIKPLTIDEYNEIRRYCNRNRWELVKKATSNKRGDNPISIAEQVASALQYPYSQELEEAITNVTYNW